MGIKLPDVPPYPPDAEAALASGDRFERLVRPVDLLASRRHALDAVVRNDLALRRVVWRTLQLAAGGFAFLTGLAAWDEWRGWGGEWDTGKVTGLLVAAVLAAGLAVAVQVLAFRRGRGRMRGDLRGRLCAWAWLGEHPDLRPLLLAGRRMIMDPEHPHLQPLPIEERKFHPRGRPLRRALLFVLGLPLAGLGAFLLLGACVYYDPGRDEDGVSPLLIALLLAGSGAVLLAVGVLCVRKAVPPRGFRPGRLGNDPPARGWEPLSARAVPVGPLDVAVVFVLAAATVAGATRLLGEAAWWGAMPVALGLLVVALRSGARWWYPAGACAAAVGMFIAGAGYAQQQALHERGEWRGGIVALRLDDWRAGVRCEVADADTGETIGEAWGCDDLHAGQRVRVLADPRGEATPSLLPPTPHLHREAFAGCALAFTASLTIGTLTRWRRPAGAG
jgi:hypothetical protein